MEHEHKSKTQKKNEYKALQKMGEQLVGLSLDQLKNIHLPEELFTAVTDAHQMTQHEAKRRQLQYIGKLMRDIDSEPIEKYLFNIQQGDFQKSLAFKKMERWRDELKAGNSEIIEDILNICPSANRQRLNQLARNARKSKEDAKAAKASKALFQYLKEIYNG